MAFLKTFRNPPAIIITTAYHQYTIEGFTLNVTDYLLKPIEFERFIAAVNKVKLAINISLERNKKAINKDYIFVSIQKKKVKILFSDILYIESQKEYIKIVTLQKVYVTKIGTREIEALLPNHLFQRIHRSFIVAISKITSYTAEIIEVNGVTLPIGRGYKDFIKYL